MWKPRFKWTYLCMSSFSAFRWPENAISAESWNTWCNFWRVIKPTVHRYMASSSSISAFWKPDNFYFWRVMKPTIQSNVLPCCSFYAFWRPENAISTECDGRVSPFGYFRIRILLIRNTKGLRVPNFLWPHFLHFVGLKMRILKWSCEHFDGLKFLSMPIRENHGSRDRSFLWSLYLHLGAYKCYFCQVVYHTIQTYLAFCEIIFCNSVAQKCFLSRVSEHTVQGYLVSCELIF